jgi:hypothetical protein
MVLPEPGDPVIRKRGTDGKKLLSGAAPDRMGSSEAAERLAIYRVTDWQVL